MTYIAVAHQQLENGETLHINLSLAYKTNKESNREEKLLNRQQQ
jgi:hypothetical protein